jgi:iron complex outermembrane receptor protein
LAAATCLGLLLLWAAPGRAQEPIDLTAVSLEDLAKVQIDTVYGASRYNQSIREAPASVTVISAAEIAAYGHRTLADVLASVMGLHVRYDRAYTYLGVRGFSRPGDYGSRVLVLVDGHRMNDNIYDQSSLGTEFPIDVEMIQRVEVIRGANASLYGTSALLAVVNVVTLKGSRSPGLAGRFQAGSQGTLGGALVYGAHHANGLDLLFSASSYGSDGRNRLYFPEYAGDATTGGLARDVDRDRADRFFANVGFGGLRARAVFGSRTKHFPTGMYDTILGDTRTKARDARGYADVQYEKSIRFGTVTARGYYDHYGYDGTWAYEDDTTESGLLNRDRADGDLWGSEIRLTTLPGRAHRGSIGFEFVQNLDQRQENFDVEPISQVHLASRVKGRDFAVYGQDQWQVSDRLALNGSLRFDRRARFDWTLSPRAAVIVDVMPQTTVKGIYSRVFRFPNAYEQFYGDQSTQKSNPNLDPESVDTLEALVDHRVNGHLRVTAGTFFSRFSDLIDQRTDPVDDMMVFSNRERLTTRGVEVEAEWRRNSQEPPVVRASYSRQLARDETTDRSLTDSPKNMFNLNALAPLDGLRTTAGLEVQFVGRRDTRARSSVAGAWVTNLTLSRARILPRLDLTFSAYNLFNTRYAHPTSGEFRQDILVQDGRTVRLRLTYHIW